MQLGSYCPDVMFGSCSKLRTVPRADIEHVSDLTPSIAFRHFPPNSDRIGYATEGALFVYTLRASLSGTFIKQKTPKNKKQKQNSAKIGYATEGALFVLHTESITFWHLPKKKFFF